jgi:hypothetical protein
LPTSPIGHGPISALICAVPNAARSDTSQRDRIGHLCQWASMPNNKKPDRTGSRAGKSKEPPRTGAYALYAERDG